jgi:4-hydroxy-2-oxoheptanedioate aldolase
MKQRVVRLGGWLAIPDPLVVEAAGRAGYDWVGLDLQHGAWDVGSAARAIQILDLMNVPVVVRVPDEELQLIPHVLDQGASGIVIAMTRSAQMVADAIARARYQPEGLRSYGGQRYGMRHEPDDVTTIRPAIHAMVESREAVERIASIASVPGLASIHVGPADLAISLGLGRDRANAQLREALRHIVEGAHSAGLPAVMHAVASEQVTEMLQLGFDELVLNADIHVLRRAFAVEISRARGDVEGYNGTGESAGHR